MVVVWRGWGPLALFAAIPALGSIVYLIDREPRWLCFASVTVSLIFGGATCVYVGTRLNLGSGEHSLYAIPLEVFGWLYLVLAAPLPLLAMLGGIVRAIRQPRGQRGPGDVSPMELLLFGGVGVLILTMTLLLLVRGIRARRRPAGEEPRVHDGSHPAQGEWDV